jgi:DNA-directed RNA polymerase subunit RPC12/RpoP
MLRKEFRCTRCGNRFERDVFEEGEAECQMRPTAPVRCPECGSTYIEEVRIVRHLPRRAS